MISTTSNFDAVHNLSYKTPLYSVRFWDSPYSFNFTMGFTIGTGDEETGTHFSNGNIQQPILDENSASILDEDGEAIFDAPTHYQYLKSIKGGSQTVTPIEGSSSISGITAEFVDKGNFITSIFPYDGAANLHRRKVSIKAGYNGVNYSDFVTVFTGWVTGIKMTNDLGNYVFSITDPQKWAQKYIARSATESSPVYFQGNPINIILQILLSTGEKSNGTYDFRSSENGCGIDQSLVNISEMEAIRDRYYPGDSHYLRIICTERIKAKDLIENEILKVINCYPKIDGNGRYSIIPFQPPATDDDTQSIGESDIIGLPKWDANLMSLRNEIEFKHDYDPTNNDYDTITYYADGDSINYRGQGNDQISIESHGLHLDHSPASTPSRATTIMQRRKNIAFTRWAIPPIKITFKTFFTKWLLEAGDVVKITHSLIPDIESGIRGITDVPMEIISRSIDWTNGIVTFTVLDTGFRQENPLETLLTAA